MADMDLSAYSLEELLLAAAKSEVESRDVYERTAARVNNFFLKDKLRFLAGEEEKHQAFVEAAYRHMFPGRKLVLPATTPVPLPPMRAWDEDVPLTRVIEAAMAAELAARDFYTALAPRLGDDRAAEMARYVAAMEQGHYDLLAPELGRAERFEEYAQEFPFIHVGP